MNDDRTTAPVIEPLGDRGFLVGLDDEAAAARWFAAWEERLRVRTDVIDVALAYRSVAVHADPAREDLDRLGDLLAHCEVPGPTDASNVDTRVVAEIPVLYDGPDLEQVATARELTVEAVIAAHCGPDYQVFAIGFLPGFPYAGFLPESLSGLPRRSSPRKSVPAGSVAIAGRQTGVYPQSSPGGWHLIGRTPLVIADMARAHFPIRAGDRLRFAAIERAEYQARLGEWLTVARPAPGSARQSKAILR